jgi:hypothetical protein
MRVRIFEFLTKTKNGTAVTSNVSATSASCSASIWELITWLIWIWIPVQMQH